jgi:hypothetical protein
VKGVSTPGYYQVGSILYADTTQFAASGKLTAIKPSAENGIIQVAAVVKLENGSASDGILLVRPKFISRKISDIANLQSTLDGKVDIAGDTMTGNLTIANNGPIFTLRDTTSDINDININFINHSDATVANISTVGSRLNINTTLENGLIIDADKVGIGTINAGAFFHVFEQNDENYGISNLNTPVARIARRNNVQASNQYSSLWLEVSSNNGTNTAVSVLSSIQEEEGTSKSAFTIKTRALNGTSPERFRITSGGNVGIGTGANMSATARLHVAGVALFQGSSGSEI